MARFVRGKKFETTDGFPKIPVQKSVETMARFARGKKFETTDGFPTIPVEKIAESMPRFVRGKKFETTMDLQQSNLKKALKLWLDM